MLLLATQPESVAVLSIINSYFNVSVPPGIVCTPADYLSSLTDVNSLHCLTRSDTIGLTIDLSIPFIAHFWHKTTRLWPKQASFLWLRCAMSSSSSWCVYIWLFQPITLDWHYIRTAKRNVENSTFIKRQTAYILRTHGSPHGEDLTCCLLCIQADR